MIIVDKNFDFQGKHSVTIDIVIADMERRDTKFLKEI